MVLFFTFFFRFGCTNRPFYQICVFPDRALGRRHEDSIIEQVCHFFRQIPLSMVPFSSSLHAFLFIPITFLSKYCVGEPIIIIQVGTFDPLPNTRNEKLVALNIERIKYWIGERNVHVSVPVLELLGMYFFYSCFWRPQGVDVLIC